MHEKSIHLIIKGLFLIIFVQHSFLLKSQVDLHHLELSKFDAYIEKSIGTWKIPGLAIAIVKDDSLVFAKGYGVRNIQKEDKVDKETIFAIASLTKSFTVASLARLVDEGKISWDDKVTKYLPYFKLYDPCATNEITIRDLLSHRAGFKTFSGDLLWYYTTYSRRQVIERIAYLKPEYGFRSHFGYSNLMFLAAGEIIPVVTKLTWDDYLKENFFIPLNMVNTTTNLADLKLMKNVAFPHAEVNDTLQPMEYMPWDNVAPAAAINSNVSDMSKWMKLQLNHGVLSGTKFFSEGQQFEFWSPQTIETIQRGWERFWPSMHFKAYGMGWELFDYQGKKIVFHSGGADGMSSLLILIPEEKIGMVILTNTSSFFPIALMYQFMDSYFGIKDPDWTDFYFRLKGFIKNNERGEKQKFIDSHIANTKPSLESSKYSGIYQGALYGNAQVEVENNHLVLKMIPAPNLIGDLTHWHLDTYVIKLRNSPTLPPGTVQFIIDAKGEVSELKIDIPNPDYDFKELEFKKINN